MSTNPAGARVGNVLRYARAELKRLEKLPAEHRLPATFDVLDALEELANEARQVRAKAVLDLRHPDIGRMTWREVVLVSGRDVTFQAVQQWAEQHRVAP